MNSRHRPARTKPKAPSSNALLLTLVEHLPSYARRLVVTGESFDTTQPPCTLLQSYVTALCTACWADCRIESFFLSDLPLGSIKRFRANYGRGPSAKLAVQMSIAEARSTPSEDNDSGCAYPLLLDPACWRNGHESVRADFCTQPYLQTDKVALHRLATFARDMYEGRHDGHHVSTLPIGYGKTRDFLIPFVIDCVKRDPSQGIIVAVERIEQVKKYARQVNKAVGVRVAFPLLGHDRVSCKRARDKEDYHATLCSPYHQKYAKRAKDYQMLFTTHEMLSRRGAEPFQTWARGERVMAIIDEKPSVWLDKGNLAKKDLLTLQKRLMPLLQEKAPTTTRNVLHQTITETLEALNTLQAGTEIQLLTKLSRPQAAFLSSLLPPVDDEPEHNTLHVTLENLYRLGHGKGVLVIEKQHRHIIVAHQKPLPSLPTLILDATAEYDPEYAADVSFLALAPYEGLQPPKKRIQLMTWATNLVKSTSATSHKWRLLYQDIGKILDEVHTGKVYVVGAKAHKKHITNELKTLLSSRKFKRLRFDHYYNTKGSNAYKDAVAVVFTTVPFKGDEYYQAIALATKKEGMSAQVKVLHNNRHFTNADLDAIKIRDTVVTLTQEIGRTQIRNDTPCSLRVVLPWSDKPGLTALKAQLERQFHATVQHTPGTPTRQNILNKSKRDYVGKIVSLVAPGHTMSRSEIAWRMGITTAALRKWLGKSENKKELWGREIEWDKKIEGQRDHSIHVPLPEETTTATMLAHARKLIASESPMRRAA